MKEVQQRSLSPMRVRLLAKIGPLTAAGCREWQGSVMSNGYGQIGRGGRGSHGTGCIPAHRAVYAEFVAPIPPGMYVLHSCDNRRCVAIEHLRLGTHADNMRDRHERGRTARGERMGAAKLTEAAVLEIRDAVLTTGGHRAYRGLRARDLAQKFGVSLYTIRRIRNTPRSGSKGGSWLYLLGPP
jgi:hypothetical protein